MTTQNSQRSFKTTLKLVNERIWIVIGSILLGVLLYGGFLLATARGDADKVKQANRLVFYAAIGFAVALVSFVIVQLVTNIF